MNKTERIIPCIMNNYWPVSMINGCVFLTKYWELQYSPSDSSQHIHEWQIKTVISLKKNQCIYCLVLVCDLSQVLSFVSAVPSSPVSPIISDTSLYGMLGHHYSITPTSPCCFVTCPQPLPGGNQTQKPRHCRIYEC